MNPYVLCAAAYLAQVDPLEAPEQRPERDRSRQVGGRAQEVGVHDDGEAGAPAPAGCTRVQNAVTSSSDSVRGQSGGRLAISVAP